MLTPAVSICIPVARLDSVLIEQDLCRSPLVVGRFHFPVDVSAQAKFFVAMGVISMLYALVALVGYVLLHDTYTSRRVVPTAVSVVCCHIS